MPLAPLAITVAMLILGAADMPYGYYTLLRLVACVIFVWAAYISFTRKFAALPWVYGLIALLFNPVWKVSFSKQTWVIVDIGAGLILLATAKFVLKRRSGGS